MTWIDLNGLLLGAATAAYQIEGAAHEGGRGSSIWDDLSHRPGAIMNGDTGDVATDHYHRWREDVEIMRELGLEAYRLSIAWPRVQPGGSGPINQEGIDFYRDLLTEVRAAGIATWVTLYHWDLPSELEAAGGWSNRATVDAFADYARSMGELLGDLVDGWITLNEPWCSAYLGYASGVHAPGVVDPGRAFAAVHHLNLAHGRAVGELRKVVPSGTPIGVTLNLHVSYPSDPSSQSDRDAVEIIDTLGNRAFLDPMLHGRLPERLREIAAPFTDFSFVKDGDLAKSQAAVDFLGINYYSTQYLRWNEDPNVDRTGGHGVGAGSPWPGSDGVEFLPPEGPLTRMGWNIEPHGLTDLLVRTGNEFPELPLYVTENGAAFEDVVVEEADGRRVHDPLRQDYVARHLAAVEKARQAGADVRGYFLWSLLDNFEWSWGYDRRFGIVHVDYPTGERTVKDSARWYARVIADKGLSWSRR